jgi:hypothetical protein
MDRKAISVSSSTLNDFKIRNTINYPYVNVALGFINIAYMQGDL